MSQLCLGSVQALSRGILDSTPSRSGKRRRREAGNSSANTNDDDDDDDDADRSVEEQRIGGRKKRARQRRCDQVPPKKSRTTDQTFGFRKGPRRLAEFLLRLFTPIRRDWVMKRIEEWASKFESLQRFGRCSKLTSTDDSI